MTEDILERAKKALIDDDMTYEDYDECISLLIAEVERLRSLNESLMENGNDLRTRCQKAEARIKELEATKERLQSAPKSGLYGKYIIQKADGSPVDPEADYFILRLDADPVARIAALEYAIQTDDQKLGEMLEKRVMDHVFSKDDDQCRKRVEGWPIGQIKQLRKQIASKDARIKAREAEITAWVADRDSWIGRYEAVRKEKDARIADQEAYIERLEAAFLEQFVQGIQAPREMAELMAHEALEKIKQEARQ